MFNGVWKSTLIFLSVVGPGIITANVDNDAGGITTYSLAGADFGYGLLWTLLPVTVALILIQEMAARLGAVTGRGLSDLIRERYGVRWTVLVLLSLFVANLGNTLAEFSGVAASMGIFGISKYLSVPVVAFLVWLLVLKGNYQRIERIFLGASLFYLTYILSGIMAHPHWGPVLAATVTPRFQLKEGAIAMVIGIIGTTIAPWMQFYLQSSVADKHLQVKDYWATRWDVSLGCLVTNLVAFFIIVACAETIHRQGIRIQDAKDAAIALAPLAGKWSSWLFALGLLNASVFSASILPLATSYSICEGLGWESGLDRTFQEAPVFYTLYTLLIILGAGLTLIPNLPLIAIMYGSQVANGVLLPLVLIFSLKLVNRKSLMGNFSNGPIGNVIIGGLVIILIALTLAMLLIPLGEWLWHFF